MALLVPSLALDLINLTQARPTFLQVGVEFDRGHDGATLTTSTSLSVVDLRGSIRCLSTLLLGGNGRVRGEDGLKVSEQRRLVFLDGQEVIAAVFADFPAENGMSEHGVGCDDGILQRQQPQEFESRLVLIGLGVDSQFREHDLSLVRIGGHEMHARDALAGRAAQRLSVNGDRTPTLGVGLPGQPSTQRRLESRETQDRRKRVPSPLALPWIRNSAEEFDQAR